jgi:hypothetical protein
MTVAVAALAFALWAGPSIASEPRPDPLAVQGAPQQSFDVLREAAFRYLGRPYRSGGVGEPAFDCSGFVCRIFAENGYGLPRTSREQSLIGVEVPLDQVQPGDLLFFADRGRDVSHVGLYLGNGEMIHASTGRGEVTVSDLGSRWFQRRLIGARRILGGEAPALPAAQPPPAIEIPPAPIEGASEVVAQAAAEHEGERALLAPVRVEPRRGLRASYGPELSRPEATQAAVRAAAVTEAGRPGWVVAPELSLVVEDVALELTLALPIRFDGGAPDIGPVRSLADASRLLRRLSLGLPGADLELSLSRLGDLSLLDGAVVDHLAPGVQTAGVPGLTVGRSPLSFSGAVRTDALSLEALVDDVVEPGLGAAAARLDLGTFSVGIGAASDRRAGAPGSGQAVDALQVTAEASLLELGGWSLEASGGAAGLAALGQLGGGAHAALTARHLLGADGVSGLELEARASYLGPRFVDGVFGPTYLVFRPEHLAALDVAGARAGLGGRVLLRLSRFTVGGGYGEGLGRGRVPLDRHAEAVVELERLPVGGTRLLDVRLAYLARAPFDPAVATLAALQASLRLRLSSWLHAEAYLQKGQGLQGGAGLSAAFAP